MAFLGRNRPKISFFFNASLTSPDSRYKKCYKFASGTRLFSIRQLIADLGLLLHFTGVVSVSEHFKTRLD